MCLLEGGCCCEFLCVCVFVCVSSISIIQSERGRNEVLLEAISMIHIDESTSKKSEKIKDKMYQDAEGTSRA